MTAEEIRAEAIERITRAIREGHEASGLTDGFGGYECRCGQSWASSTLWGCPAWRTAPEVAAGYVDALGDLLPTQTEWAVSWTDTRYGTRERQDASIECRDDAERFRHEYSDNDDYPELTDVRVERRYRTDWKAATK